METVEGEKRSPWTLPVRMGRHFGNLFSAAQLFQPLLLPVLLVLVWIYASAAIENRVILPGVSAVVELLSRPNQDLISMGSLAANVAVSLARVMAGYLAAVAVAVPLGILMGYYGAAYRTFTGFLGLFRPIPPLAWVPLVLAWFGISSLATVLDLSPGKWYIYLHNLKLSMIFIIFIGAFFPILTSTIHGVKGVRKSLLDASRVLGARETDLFRKVILPAAAPSIVTGMRIGLGVAWMCLVSAEMLPGSLSGVGYLITHAFTVARTDIVIAGMISIGAVGALMDLFFRRYEEHRFRWQRLTR